ncbi:MAG: helix-turn-helix transcriptional regulator [Bacteroidota bacterium]
MKIDKKGLLKLLEGKGITKAKLARKADLTRGTLDNFFNENSEIMPRPTTIGAIQSALLEMNFDKDEVFQFFK